MAMTKAERHKEFTDAQGEALEKYFSTVQSFVPGCSTVFISKDIFIRSLNIVLKRGPYFIAVDLDIKGGVKTQESNDGHIYLFVLDMSGIELEIDVNDAGKDIRTKLTPNVETPGVMDATQDGGGNGIKGTAKLVPVKAEAREDPITLTEAVIWAAINDADDSGDHEKGQRLFKELYQLDKDRGEELLKQDTRKPREHVQGISRFTEQIPNVPTTGKGTPIRMEGRNETREVQTLVSLTYEDNGTILSRPMTPYDQEIHNAVASLWVAGNKRITPRQVYQTMTGSTAKPSASAIEKVEESLDKQRRTFVKLDFSQELRGKTYELDGEEITPAQARLETYMLNADKVTLTTANGREVPGYEFKDEPVLYRHDRTTKQLISYPQALLEATSKVASNTETNMLIRSYLIKRIKTMSRKGSKLSKQIKYETIYKAAGKQDVNRKDAGRMNETIRKYLDAFQAEGVIAGWTEYKDAGRSHKIIGVTISTKQAGQ